MASRFTVTFEAVHGDGIRQLRWLLKDAGRRRGLRTLDAVETNELRPDGARCRGAHSPHHDKQGVGVMNTALQLQKAQLPVDDGWDAAGTEEAEHLIRGVLLRFHDWRYVAGKQGTLIPDGTQLVALATVALWQRWENGKVVEAILREPGKLLPAREELGRLDTATWEKDANGTPRDPWVNTRLVYFVHPVSAAIYTFSTSSGGGRSAVSALAGAIKRMRSVNSTAVPIVKLGGEEMPTKFGLKSKPKFEIVGWKGIAETEPPTQLTADTSTVVPDFVY